MRFYDLITGASAGLPFRVAPLPCVPDDQQQTEHFNDCDEHVMWIGDSAADNKCNG